MSKRNYTAEQIISKLREVEVKIGQGNKASEAIRSIGVSEQTYYCWKKEYGEMHVEQAKRLRELEKENNRLKRLVADQALDIATLKDISSGNL